MYIYIFLRECLMLWSVTLGLLLPTSRGEREPRQASKPRDVYLDKTNVLARETRQSLDWLEISHVIVTSLCYWLISLVRSRTQPSYAQKHKRSSWGQCFINS